MMPRDGLTWQPGSHGAHAKTKPGAGTPSSPGRPSATAAADDPARYSVKHRPRARRPRPSSRCRPRPTRSGATEAQSSVRRQCESREQTEERLGQRPRRWPTASMAALVHSRRPAPKMPTAKPTDRTDYRPSGRPPGRTPATRPKHPRPAGRRPAAGRPRQSPDPTGQLRPREHPRAGTRPGGAAPAMARRNAHVAAQPHGTARRMDTTKKAGRGRENATSHPLPRREPAPPSRAPPKTTTAGRRRPSSRPPKTASTTEAGRVQERPSTTRSSTNTKTPTSSMASTANTREHAPTAEACLDTPPASR